MEPVIFFNCSAVAKHIFGAISSVPRSSKCSKIVGGWGFAPDPAGGAYSAAPDPLAGIKGPYF